MGTTTSVELSTASSARSGALAVPWHLWVAALSITCAMVGGHWDIAWHRSIGRDGFWTAPHVALYLCGVFAGVSCGALILGSTFRRETHGTVRIWGLRGPLGAFLAAWGGIAMLTSAPFDDWWHNAYGLDVKILSPPHVLLFVGSLAVYVGTLLLVLGRMNRAEGDERAWLSGMFLYVGGGIVVALMLVTMEHTHPIHQHSGAFYEILCGLMPIAFASVRVASDRRWAATIVAGIYSAFLLGLIWVMPLVHAAPKLGPVYQHVTHLIPPAFPVLFVVPALLFDLGWQRRGTRSDWALAGLGGLGFFVSLLAVEWPAAAFLLGPNARNAIFGMDYYDYNAQPWFFSVRHVFRITEHSLSELIVELAVAAALAVLATRLGLLWGRWMARVQR